MEMINLWVSNNLLMLQIVIVIYGVAFGVRNYFIAIVGVISLRGYNQSVLGMVIDFIWTLMIILVSIHYLKGV